MPPTRIRFLHFKCPQKCGQPPHWTELGGGRSAENCLLPPNANIATFSKKIFLYFPLNLYFFRMIRRCHKLPPFIFQPFSFALLFHFIVAELSNGEYPWTYDNDLFGGPDFWGLMHKHWRMCKAGKLQSPINIDPEKLVFDPGLTKLAISKGQLDADLWNTGQFPLLNVNLGNSSAGQKGGKIGQSASTAPQSAPVTITGGPAYPYTYQFQQLLFHFGDLKKGERGSEHTIDRVRFPAEVQMIAFNSDLYENFTQALSQPRGLLAIGLIVDIGDKTNSELKRLTNVAPSIKHRNQMVRVRHFQPSALLPSTEQFVSYEGSLTFPGCFETVTWILFNSPIYMSAENLAVWSELVQNEKPTPKEDKKRGEGDSTVPPVPLSSNYRPLKANNGRMIRTNINVKLKPPTDGGNCPSNVYVDMGYRSNPSREEKRLVGKQQSQQKRGKGGEKYNKYQVDG